MRRRPGSGSASAALHSFHSSRLCVTRQRACGPSRESAAAGSRKMTPPPPSLHPLRRPTRWTRGTARSSAATSGSCPGVQPQGTLPTAGSWPRRRRGVQYYSSPSISIARTDILNVSIVMFL
ncbi:uncharacterized protein LOC123404388 isoform X2 [Hordeum vulgare subsp. vulgare]|uniref:uncharacterized protein LOC123404388 isoform X2 n=1 Tax=Hordeum vulgare subsp. vulgare TaxID=112509 RepID=UPI001D1A3FB5|nr:uncharacterized protein LOC123404388 isoform X2 [Hordeum vulgare subsp. vulgare]